MPICYKKEEISIWDTYEALLKKHEGRGMSMVDKQERFDFYEEAAKAYAIVATGERSQYANLILQKGCIIS